MIFVNKSNSKVNSVALFSEMLVIISLRLCSSCVVYNPLVKCLVTILQLFSFVYPRITVQANFQCVVPLDVQYCLVQAILWFVNHLLMCQYYSYLICRACISVC